MPFPAVSEAVWRGVARLGFPYIIVFRVSDYYYSSLFEIRMTQGMVSAGKSAKEGQASTLYCISSWYFEKSAEVKNLDVSLKRHGASASGSGVM